MIPLPIDSVLPDVVRELRTNSRLVLEAPAGAGKTTRVPRALLDAGWGERGEIVVLEPRRLAARLAAARVASELGEPLGETVGYQVRFEQNVSSRTRIRFVTEGILAKRLLSPDGLRGVSAVVLDEFHERHLQGDLAFALLEYGRMRREHDLTTIIMSATLDSARLAERVGGALLRSDGRLFPVSVQYDTTDLPLPKRVASAARALLRTAPSGDILVFLPGAREIAQAMRACEDVAQAFDVDVLMLHGDLSPAEQDRAVRPSARRRIVLSTNLAESSVTLEGVFAVIDSGLSRVAVTSPWSGLRRLDVDKASRSSILQRTGRAGRVREGMCVRLFSEADFESRRAYDPPEIERVDWSETYLSLAAVGKSDLPWLDPPRDEAVRAAQRLLTLLGALTPDGSVTPEGKRISALGIHPRLGKLILEGARRGILEDAAVVAALLLERDIIPRSTLSPHSAREQGSLRDLVVERSDLSSRVELFHEVARTRFLPSEVRAAGLDVRATEQVRRAHADLLRAARSLTAKDASLAPSMLSESALLHAVFRAFPDRIARRVRVGSDSLALANGGQARLSGESVVREAPWLVVVEGQTAHEGGALVRMASAIEPEWVIDVLPEHVSESSEVLFDEAKKRVSAASMLSVWGLVLARTEESSVTEPMSEVLAREALARHLPYEDEAFGRTLMRLRFVAARASGATPLDEAWLLALMREACAGKRSFDDLRGVDFSALARARAGRDVTRLLDELAPERIRLAAGRTVAIEYELDKPPWAESYLQDFFGMQRTPTVGRGEPVVLHLLAPNRRAVQITSDLEGFWLRHYPTIRKELMRKYPRHTWPEDPTVPIPRFKRDLPKGG